MSFRLYLLLFLLLLVLEFAVIGDFGYGRVCIWRSLNQIQPSLPRFCKSVFNRHYAEIFARRPQDAHLARANALVHADALLFLLRSVFCESHLLGETIPPIASRF